MRPAHHPHIAALDGLRFVAAGTVMISHAVLWQYLLHGPLDPWKRPFLAWCGLHFANFGMTLFFVLSGFVIHHNYRTVVQQPGGLRAFFIARCSRLYPAFLLVFFAGLLHLAITKGVTQQLLSPIPLYLTLTQSWWYWSVGGMAAASAYQEPFLGVLWSLSTEAFFYCLFPFIAPSLAKLSLRKAASWMAVIGGIFFIIGAALVPNLDHIYLLLRSSLGDASTEQFVHWFAYNSPWPRIGEFVLGALASQVYLSGFRLDRRTADRVVISSIGAIALTFTLIFLTKSSYYAANDMTMIAPAFALICLAAAASPESFTSRLLSRRTMIWCGEASYSLYLIHSAVQVKLSDPIFNLYDVHFTYSWAVVSFIASIILARLLYISYERPAMKYFRRIVTDASPTAVRVLP